MERPGYQRAFSSLGCAEMSLPEVMALAQRQHLPAVELRALGGSIDLPAYFEQHFGEPGRLAEYVTSTGVSVVALDASCRLMADDAAGEAELLALAPWAEALGGVPIRVFDGGDTLDETNIAAGVARWKGWQRHRERQGWNTQLIVETHDTLVTGEAVRRFLAAAPTGVVILWDAFHTWSKGDEAPTDTWDQIRVAVGHIHVKDGKAGGTEGRAFTHTLPGQGSFPMAALRERLQEDGYRGPLSLEWGRKWHPYLPPLEDALGAARAGYWW